MMFCSKALRLRLRSTKPSLRTPTSLYPPHSLHYVIFLVSNHVLKRYLYHEKKGNSIRLYMTRYAFTLGRFVNTRRAVPSLPPLSALTLHCKMAISHLVCLKAFEAGKGERFTQQQLCKFLLEIASGLDFLKKHKIIHRYPPLLSSSPFSSYSLSMFSHSDLKTENIFVTLDSHSEVKRLTIGDFDSAKRVQTQNVHAKTTIGTPGYMAPVLFLRFFDLFFSCS